ncbi:hypothetical protein [Sphingomonas sp. Leaf17]|uniref:hypothetical protein n=1 Tax=Sphingomonas sp. Leaf17 TaxID=1735683 RepID=UPI0012E1D830|nr:hypothetical protein [Sphingomonas sp. Leaf17]
MSIATVTQGLPCAINSRILHRDCIQPAQSTPPARGVPLTDRLATEAYLPAIAVLMARRLV